MASRGPIRSARCRTSATVRATSKRTGRGSVDGAAETTLDGLGAGPVGVDVTGGLAAGGREEVAAGSGAAPVQPASAARASATAAARHERALRRISTRTMLRAYEHSCHGLQG